MIYDFELEYIVEGDRSPLHELPMEIWWVRLREGVLSCLLLDCLGQLHVDIVTQLVHHELAIRSSTK
jgi:hypothetical protein